MNDLLGGFGSIVKGLSGLLPQDDPDVKLLTTQSNLSDLKKQETELYAEIGRRALEQQEGRFPELESRLKLVQTSIAATEQELAEAQAQKQAKDTARRIEQDARTCSNCGIINPEGVKFCQECGTKLGANLCRQCGSMLAPGARFCGECGAKQEG